MLAAGVFAAIMSSLDSQTLAVGTMLTKNAAARVPRFAAWSQSRQALLGRIFVAGFLVVVFVLSLVSTQTIFSLGIWALSGFSTFFPVLVGAIYWKRSTGAGAAAGILSGLLLWTWFFVASAGAPGWTIAESGVEPAAAIVLVSRARPGGGLTTHRPAGLRPSAGLLRLAASETAEAAACPDGAPAWNAGLQTGTRGAPHRARRNPTREKWLPSRRKAQEQR